MTTETLTADEVIQQIAEVLPENDGDFIEHIANQVLGRKVTYLEDSLFKYEDECDEQCCTHAPDCDGFCDHLEGHVNACMKKD